VRKLDNQKWNFHNSYINLPKIFYTKQSPTAVRNPKLVIFNQALAASLGVPLQLGVFAGNEIPGESKPIAQAYAGHQFGYFTMLGDGRAILLGEQITDSGERFDIQLKGSGPTPYSRGGDGRAALGPMLREYIISEAMYALGIPTTRSLAVVTTGEAVRREKNLPGAILTRVAKSHIRVGTFEYAARFGTIDDVRSLADYTITRHFPAIAAVENKYLLLLREGVKRQVRPATVFSSIDIHGRYAYENQPKMAAWNLARFAETLLPLLDGDENQAVGFAQEEVSTFWSLYHHDWLAGMRAKLGLYSREEEDSVLINDFLQLMEQYQADYTETFKFLTLGKNDGQNLFSQPAYQHWHERWQERLGRQPQSRNESRELMKSHNPAMIPRNHLVKEALNAAQEGDLTKMHKLLLALESPYRDTAEQEEFSQLPPPASCRYQTFCGT